MKSPCVEDAEKLLNYIKTSCGETEYLARYPEEWNTTVEQKEAWVNRLRSSPDTLGITCYVDGEVAGNCEISFRGGMKTSHRATIAIAILKDYWNLGIGSAMFEELVAAAQNRGTEIMELEFIEGNDRARHLYEKFGFRVVSEKPNAFKLKDGTYRNEFICRSICKKNDFVGKTTPNKAACRNWSVPTGGFILAIDRFILRDRFQILFQISVEYQISVLQRHIVNQIVKL